MHSHLPILCEIRPKMYAAIIYEMDIGKKETAISQVFAFIVLTNQIGTEVSIGAVDALIIENAPAAIIM